MILGPSPNMEQTIGFCTTLPVEDFRREDRRGGDGQEGAGEGNRCAGAG